MRVAMYYNNRDVRLEEMPKPKINDDEILVKVIASGVCGSDVMEWYRIKKAPRVLGHEIAADIFEVGKKVRKYKVGERVFVSHHVPCNECSYCKKGQFTVCKMLHSTNFIPGGFAEFVRVPAVNIEKNGVLILPKNVSYEEATFIEPLGCVLRGQKIMKIEKGDTVLVLGSGISGLLHIMLAKYFGAAKIIATDINENRLKAAKKFGADFAINARENIPEKVREATGGKLADKVIIAAGAISAVKQGFESADKGGTILIFAPTQPGTELCMDVWDFWLSQKKVVNTYAASPKDLKESMRLIAEKKIDVKGLVTHRFPLGKAAEAFKTVAEADNSIKVIIEPQK